MAGPFDSGFWPRHFWPDGFWPQRFWPAPLGDIADWIAAALDGQEDPGQSVTLRIVRPHIIDVQTSHFNQADVFICADRERTQMQTTEPNRFLTAFYNLYGLIRELPELTSADCMLSRIAETIRRLILSANTEATACDGLALHIDCSEVEFLSGAGFVAAQMLVTTDYCLNE